MARVWEWLSGAINCQPLLAMLTPAAPLDVGAHLRGIDDEITRIGEQKTVLINEMKAMRRELAKALAQNNLLAANTVRRQLKEHMEECKRLDARNLALVGQSNELARMHGDTEMVKMAARTTALLSEQARMIRREIRVVGGEDGIKDTLDGIAGTKEEAAAIIDFTSRALVPKTAKDYRETGVAIPELNSDEELDEYLGSFEQDTQVASSSRDPPVQRADPYAHAAPIAN